MLLDSSLHISILQSCWVFFMFDTSSYVLLQQSGSPQLIKKGLLSSHCSKEAWFDALIC